MKCNVGLVDKLIRAILGLALIAMVFVGPQTPWGWIGVVLLVTALISWCPIYAIIGMKTCKTEEKPKE